MKQLGARTTALVTALLLACAALAQTPEDREQRPARQGRSAVYGRLVNEATGRPLRRARVSLMTLGGSRVDHGALTDARGAFRIGDVPAGRYVVWAAVEGMLSPLSFAHGDRASDYAELGRHFTVVELDGKAEREVTVRARRGGAVTGRVTYADGDPAVGAQIHLLRRHEGEGRPAPTRVPVGDPFRRRTDDRGVYRVAGLPPGDYFVAVSEPVDHTGKGYAPAEVEAMAYSFSPDLQFSRQLLLTYHPSAASLKGAEAVTVRVGEESAGVDVTIPERELRTLSGVVRAARGGQPVVGAKISIGPRHNDVGGDRPFLDLLDGAIADGEGRWQLQEIPDGLYTIHVRSPEEHELAGLEALAKANRDEVGDDDDEQEDEDGPTRAPRRRKFAPVARELRVSGDMSELVFEMGEGGRIAGSVTFEGGKSLSFTYISAQRVAKTVEESAGDGSPGTPVQGGTFELEGLTPGKYYLRPAVFEEDGDFYVKAITWQGRDLLREPLEVGEGTLITGVRVVYASDPAVLRVRVRRADKQPAYNLNVFLLPADLSRWSIFMPSLSCTTAGEGSCRINAPPGDYLVVAAPLSALLGDAEAQLRRRALDAPRVTLRAGEQKTLETSSQ
jgi:hypothetical protein